MATFKEALAVILFVFCFISPAKADRVDTINGMPDIDYCTVVADQFYAGALSQMSGSQRVIKSLTPEIIEKLEHHIPLPKDAMYAPEFDQLNDREREWMTKNVMEGYDAAAQTNPDDEQVKKMAQTVFEACMYNRTKMKHTASSQNIDKPQNIHQMECLHEAKGAYDMLHEIRKGIPEEHWFEVYPIPEGFSDDAQDLIKEVVSEAYKWKGKDIDFAHKIYDQCMSKVQL